MALRIYTRTGDEGETGLFGGQRVFKDDLRIEAYGTVDELNAILGQSRTLIGKDADLDTVFATVQGDLFYLGADLATPEEEETSRGRITIQRVAPERVDAMETLIDRFEEELSPLTSFILPGGTPLAASLHIARTVCRRAERRCVTLHQSVVASGSPGVNPEVIRYLNRLSDLLFVLARVANHRQGAPDVLWKP